MIDLVVLKIEVLAPSKAFSDQNNRPVFYRMYGVYTTGEKAI
jgi:hypothetical protein